MKNIRVIILFLGFLYSGIACARGQLIYFGPNEVTSGALKSADGALPHAGNTVTLAIDILALSTTVACRPGEMSCSSLQPKLFVRFNNHESFSEIIGLPEGFINPRGPGTKFEYEGWESNQPFKVQLQIPLNANYIEAFIVYSRYTFAATNCHLEYDTTVCSIDSQQLQGLAYISNYGRNFKIDVMR